MTSVKRLVWPPNNLSLVVFCRVSKKIFSMKASLMRSTFPAAGGTITPATPFVCVTSVLTDRIVYPWTAAHAFPADSHLRPFVDILVGEPRYAVMTLGCVDRPGDLVTVHRHGGGGHPREDSPVRAHLQLQGQLLAAIARDLVWAQRPWIIDMYVRHGQPAAFSMASTRPHPIVSGRSIPRQPTVPKRRRNHRSDDTS